MSSSVSADYSPTTNHSYSSDFSLPPSSPVRPSRTHQDPAPPPRLSSPHIFRDIFATEAAGPTTRSPPRLPPLHGINFNETMQDVSRALQSANRAIQTAQEAFQSRRTSSNMSRRQDFVDLTNSPPSTSRDARSTDSFLMRTLHPHDSRPSNRRASNSLHEPFYPRAGPSMPAQSLFVEEDDPTSRYAGQADSLAGARRRFDNQRLNTRISFVSPHVIPRLEREFTGDAAGIGRHEEAEAILRQRVAREQWQHNQQRRQERDRLQQQRDHIMASHQSHRNRTQDQQSQSHSTQHSTSTPSTAPAQQLEPSSYPMSTGSSPSSVESVDLTSVNNQTDLAAALIHAQSSNPVGDPTASSGQPRSALTGYKCPICLEPPRNATSTICGHLFCHECIRETLKNSENIRREDAPPNRKVKGQCPVCRKELAQKDEGTSRTLVPLEIKLISKKKLEELRRQDKKRRREMEKKDKGKGKEKVNTESEADVYELSSDDQDDWGVSGSSQKENKAKRVKYSASEELEDALFGSFVNDDQD